MTQVRNANAVTLDVSDDLEQVYINLHGEDGTIFAAVPMDLAAADQFSDEFIAMLEVVVHRRRVRYGLAAMQCVGSA